MKTTKRILAVVLAVMMVVAMVPVITASAVEGTTVTTYGEFTAALKNGGNIILGADIKSSSISSATFTVSKDTTIYGEGHRIYAGGFNTKMITVANNVTFNAVNVVFDACNTAYTLISANQKSPNGCTINLTDCTVKNTYNRKGEKYQFPAVYYFGDSKGTLTNCTFTNNKTANDTTNGADVWAGAAANVTINGGTFNEVYGNANSGTAANFNVEGEATIDKLNLGTVTERTATVTVADTATVTSLCVSGEEVKLINNIDDLKAAATNGGNYLLCADIDVDKRVKIDGELTINGNGHTLTSTGDYLMFKLNTVDAKLTINNATMDGNLRDVNIIEAETKSGGKNPNNEINLTNCTVKNVRSTLYAGAINQFGSSKGVYTNCTFENNLSVYEGDSDFAKGADIWAGAAADVTINGGTYSEVYGNAGSGGSANLTVEGNAKVEKVSLGSLSGNTAKANIASTATVENVNIMGKEAILTDDNQIIGTGGQSVIPAVDDAFAGSNPFTKNFELMGVQTKAEVDNSLRFVSVISSDLLKVADDYGYIVGTTAKSKTDAMAKAGDITVESAAKYKVSCVGTNNSISGDYGKYDTDTSYKYVTAAVENITDANKTIFARVYVTVGNTTYYGDYINGSTYAGCATSLADLG